ncbi:serine/threonine-protein kinase [Actinoallomurus iriomotensis]|nr:serine/threonine-protein kinase [Actinoallomurus iriomotensis]
MVAGRYRLVERLGKGGMGTVWRAQDVVRGEDVAIKEPQLTSNLGGESPQVMVARFEREARAAAQISHPAVVDILDVISDSGRPLIVMELIKGRSLADLMDEGMLSPQQAAKVALPVAEALVAAHAAGVLHRDVKPHNIMIAHDGRVVLTDFGLAQIHGEQALTRTGMLMGSAEFLPPERVLGRVAVPASDFFGLGVVLYTAVEGYSPFLRKVPEATFQAIMSARPAEPIHAGPLAPLIMGLLDKDPERRPSGDQVIKRLRQVAEGTPPAATPTAPPATEKGPGKESGGGRRTRRAWVLPVAAIITAAAFAAGVAVATGAIKLKPVATQAAPGVTTTVTPTVKTRPAASSTPSRHPRPRTAPRTNGPSTPKRPVVPAGYVLRKVYAARLAVPSGYITTRPDDYRYTFRAAPNQVNRQLVVGSHDAPDAPKGAAARAAYWKKRFLSSSNMHDAKLAISNVTVNGRAAKKLTVVYRSSDNRYWRKQEMYYSGPEGEWKIVADYELESYGDGVDESLFLTAIRTFRV